MQGAPAKKVIRTELIMLWADDVTSEHVSLRWNENEEADELAVEWKKKYVDNEWNKTFIGEKGESKCSVSKLEPGTEYEFRVVWRKGLEARRSDVMTVRTKENTAAIPEPSEIIRKLNEYVNNPEMCTKLLEDLYNIIGNGKS